MANGIMIPISAFLIERFTTRTLFLTAISIFGAGTIISALAPIFPVLLLGRIVQASGSGIMLPLLMTVLLAIIPVERSGTAMGMIGIVIALDRKSTRLNSSHVAISYAVFCLKK